MDAPWPWIGARSARAAGGGTRVPPPVADDARGAGRVLLALALLGLARAGLRARPLPPLGEHGRVFAVRVEQLAGDEFRLLPGVGPVLASRLEEARRRAGGRLALDDVEDVRGVGPVLRARWEPR